MRAISWTLWMVAVILALVVGASWFEALTDESTIWEHLGAGLVILVALILANVSGYLDGSDDD